MGLKGEMLIILEKDPRDINYAALYLAIVWYKQITPEEAFRIVLGKSKAKPGSPLTPEKLERIKKIMQSPNFKNFDNIERRMRINRYDIIEALRKEKRREGKHFQDKTFGIERRDYYSRKGP